MGHKREGIRTIIGLTLGNQEEATKEWFLVQQIKFYGASPFPAENAASERSLSEPVFYMWYVTCLYIICCLLLRNFCY